MTDVPKTVSTPLFLTAHQALEHSQRFYDSCESQYRILRECVIPDFGDQVLGEIEQLDRVITPQDVLDIILIVPKSFPDDRKLNLLRQGLRNGGWRIVSESIESTLTDGTMACVHLNLSLATP